MWSRGELKDRAKGVLRKNYWIAFLVSLVIAIAGGVGSGWSGGGGSSTYNTSGAYSYFINWTFILTIISIILSISVIIVLLRIFIGYSLEVGGTRYFVKSAEYKDNMKCFSFGFDGQNYFGILKTMFVKNVFIFLWTLLLIIPGIIKSYAYSMVPYILAENPNIGVMGAIRLSNEMTRGHKFDMFVLDLSFLGWFIIGALAFGIGVLFVLPYYNATLAELYLTLRSNALRNNLCRYEDLLLDKSESDNGIY